MNLDVKTLEIVANSMYRIRQVCYPLLAKPVGASRFKALVQAISLVDKTDMDPVVGL